jgi:hypothetical protein
LAKRSITVLSTASSCVRKAALTLVGATLAFGSMPTLAAHAAKVTWQNEGTGRYLEVYQSSTSTGAYVGTYPWNGSATQYWLDSRLSDNYWVEANYNSGLLLTTYNDCGNGITQWTPDSGNHAYSTQEWHENHLSTDVGWALINKAGCSGDPYHDVLSQSLDQPNLYNVFLYSEHSGGCDMSLFPEESPENYCTWK